MKNKTLIGNSSLWENDCFCARFNEGEKDNIYKTMEKKNNFLNWSEWDNKLLQHWLSYVENVILFKRRGKKWTVTIYKLVITNNRFL